MTGWEREFGRVTDKEPEDVVPETYRCVGCNEVIPNDRSLYGRGVSHCMACHLTFKSLAGFDEHRMSGSAPDYLRRCRTETELRKRGFEPNDKGFWRKPRPVDTIPGRKP